MFETVRMNLDTFPVDPSKTYTSPPRKMPLGTVIYGDKGMAWKLCKATAEVTQNVLVKWVVGTVFNIDASAEVVVAQGTNRKLIEYAGGSAMTAGGQVDRIANIIAGGGIGRHYRILNNDVRKLTLAENTHEATTASTQIDILNDLHMVGESTANTDTLIGVAMATAATGDLFFVQCRGRAEVLAAAAVASGALGHGFRSTTAGEMIEYDETVEDYSPPWGQCLQAAWANAETVPILLFGNGIC